MASFQVKLFKNTGFNLDNIPDSYNLLYETEYIEVDAIWVYQDRILSSIRVSSTFDEVESVDYCGLEVNNIIQTCYFVTDIKMVNPKTAELILRLDALTTIGIFTLANNIAGGWCVRRHVMDDTLFSNNIPENFTPSEPLKIDYDDTFKGEDLDTIIIASTVDLDNTGVIGKTFTDASTNLSVTVPQLPTITNPTRVDIIVVDGVGYHKTTPNIKLYNYGRNPERYSKALSTLWSLGMIDSITNMYTIPSEQMTAIYDNDDDVGVSGGIVVLKYESKTKPSNIAKTWSYNVNNNKVFADQFNKITVASYTSADMLDFSASDISGNDDTFRFIKMHDLGPNGKPYIRPALFQGLGYSNDGVWFQFVSGNIWPNTNSAFQAREGWAINQKLYSQDVVQQGYDGLFGVLDTILGIVGMSTTADVKPDIMWDGGFTSTGYTQMSPTTDRLYASQITSQSGINPMSIINNIRQGVSNSSNVSKSRINYITNNALVAPTIKFPREDNLSNYIGNGFYILRTRLSDNDTKRFDRYLTEFGYSVNEELQGEAFYGRYYFNYIQVTDTILKPIKGLNRYIIDEAIARLEAGVRIWHKPVTPEAFINNPITDNPMIRSN